MIKDAMFFLMVILLKREVIGDSQANIYKETPYLNINYQISLLPKEISSKQAENEDPYLGKFVNKDLLSSFTKLFPLDKDKESPSDLKVLYSSVIWLPDEKLFLAALNIKTSRSLNYIYVTFLDSDWKDAKKESIIGSTKIPWAYKVPTLAYFGYGIIFKALEDDYFLSFSVKNEAWDYFLFSFKTEKIRKIDYDGKETLFSPLIIDEYHIYFLASYDNLQIIDCTDEESKCSTFIYDYNNKAGLKSSGVSFLRYRNSNYFFSLALASVDYTKDKACELLMPSLTILQVLTESPFFKLIYLSEPIILWNKLLLSAQSLTKNKNSSDYWLYCGMKIIPNSIAKWDEDEEDITEIIINSNNNPPVLLKLEGLSDVLQSVISDYESKSLIKEPKQPVKGVISNYEAKSISKEPKQPEDLVKETEPIEIDKTCEDGKYYDEAAKTCKPCFKVCLKCTSFSNCLHCRDPNAVVDNGICKCVEGFVSHYDPDTHEFLCQCNFYPGYDKVLPIDADYKDLFDIELGYQINQDSSLSMVLSNKDTEKSFSEINYCDFDTTKEKSHQFVSKIAKNGISVEIEVKFTKI